MYQDIEVSEKQIASGKVKDAVEGGVRVSV